MEGLFFAIAVAVGVSSPYTGHDEVGCPPASRRAVGSAEFTVVDPTGSERVAYEAATNLVFCQRTSDTMVWIRLAQESGANGESGPHLDLDLCNVTSSADFTAMPARANPCPGGTTWALWWHDGSGGVFANGAGSTSCDLSVSVVSDGLEGTFSCRGLDDTAGNEVDIVDGSFRCEWREGPAARP